MNEIEKRYMYEKEDWVIAYLKNIDNIGIDMLNEKFVDEYIKEFTPKYKVMLWGANRCIELSKLLSSMYNQGILKRTPIGIPNSPPGMPKWIYVYELTELGKRM